MKRSKFMPVFIVSLVLFLGGFFLGYEIMNKNINPNTSNMAKVEKNDLTDQGDLEIVKDDNIISPNTFIETRIHYKTCDHLISEIEQAGNEIINFNREEYNNFIKSNYPNLRLISFSNSKIVLAGEKKHRCLDHYIIGESDGYIAIFKIGEDGEKILDHVFEKYPLSLLPEVDQEDIRNEIVVDSEEELADILENYIS